MMQVSQRRIVCHICHQSLHEFNIDDIVSHIDNHFTILSTKEFFCNICAIFFDSKKGFKKHLNLKLSQKQTFPATQAPTVWHNDCSAHTSQLVNSRFELNVVDYNDEFKKNTLKLLIKHLCNEKISRKVVLEIYNNSVDHFKRYIEYLSKKSCENDHDLDKFLDCKLENINEYKFFNELKNLNVLPKISTSRRSRIQRPRGAHRWRDQRS